MAIVDDNDEDGQQFEDDQGETLDVDLALKSQEFKKYIAACSELTVVDITSLSMCQKVAFFLNVYQCMYVHFFLKKVNEDENKEEQEDQGIMGNIKQYVFSYSPKPFYYKIGGFNYNLEEIKHGLLRNNMKAPFYYMRSLNSSDERVQLLSNFFDPRIDFVCLDYPYCLELIDAFTGSTDEELDQELENFVTNVFESSVSIDIDQKEIQLPKTFQTYAVDFD